MSSLNRRHVGVASKQIETFSKIDTYPREPTVSLRPSFVTIRIL